MAGSPTGETRIYAAPPRLHFGGREDERAATLLSAMRMDEAEGGLSRLELRFSNWASTRGGGAELAFAAGSRLEHGTKVEVYVGDQAEARPKIFGGVVSAIEAEFRAGGPPDLVLLAEDALQAARMARRSRTYAGKSPKAVVEQIARGLGLSPVVAGLDKPVATWAQLDESDLAFLRRLLLRFDADLQIVGGELHVSPRDAVRRGATVELAQDDLGRARFSADLADQVTAVTVRGWNAVSGAPASGRAPDGAAGAGGGATARRCSGAPSASAASTSRTSPRRPTRRRGAIAQRRVRAAHAALRARRRRRRRHARPARRRARQARRARPALRQHLLRRARRPPVRPDARLAHRVRRRVRHARPVVMNRDAAFAPFDRAAATLLGAHLARVVSIADPDSRSRVQVRLVAYDGVAGQDAPLWARVVSPFAGSNRGAFLMPDVDDEVLVVFAGGTHHPLVLGGLWNGAAAPPAGLGADGNRYKRIRSKNGVTVTLDDQAGQETLTLETPGGQRLTLKDGPGSVTLEDVERQLGEAGERRHHREGRREGDGAGRRQRRRERGEREGRRGDGHLQRRGAGADADRHLGGVVELHARRGQRVVKAQHERRPAVTHPIVVGAPRDLAAPGAPGAPTAPLILQTANTQFVDATFEALRSGGGRSGLRAQTAAARGRDHVLKLYQPIQRQFHLALVEAWCETAGTPRLDPARVDSAGIVVRRVRRDAGGGVFHEGWMKRSGRVLGWARVERLGADGADPQPARRLPHLPPSGGRSPAPAVDRALRAQALGSADALLEESTTPLFVAPPDVCGDAGRTVFLGVVPTASSELAAQPAPEEDSFGSAFGPDSADFVAHLAGALRGAADSFPLAGETVLPQWAEVAETPTRVPPGNLAAQPPGLPDAHHAVLRDPEGAGAVGMRRFLLLLRQLASEFDAFGDGAAARAVQAELAAIRLPLVRRRLALAPSSARAAGAAALFEPERSVDAATFLGQAAAVLIAREPGAPQPEMIAAWPALAADRAARLRRALSAALRARFAQVAGGAAGRYDEPGAQYVLRAFVRLKADAGGCARTLWSAPSEPFRIAPWYDDAGAPPVRIALPDPTRDFLKSLKPNVAFAVPASLQALLAGNPKDLADGKGSPGGVGIGWICSFSLPVDHAVRVHRAQHLLVAVQPDLRLDGVHQDLPAVPEARRRRVSLSCPKPLPLPASGRSSAGRCSRCPTRTAASAGPTSNAACATRCAPSSPPAPASSSCGRRSAPASTRCCTSRTRWRRAAACATWCSRRSSAGRSASRSTASRSGRSRATRRSCASRSAGGWCAAAPPGRRRCRCGSKAEARERTAPPRPNRLTAPWPSRPPASTTAASTTWSRTSSRASRRTRRNGPTRASATPAAR